jgi:peroxiredoxin family protein
LPCPACRLGGVGTAMLRKRMKDKGVADCDDLLRMASETGVRIAVCDMSLDLLGLRLQDLVDYPGLEVCGVATFLSDALDCSATLFI